ncbi:MAG: hypothetical protein FGF52_01235 [Candidatus Brockarchaeota archaeon]|nr:hypothetical protein [Candidatus Brockarchaeota archaeon]
MQDEVDPTHNRNIERIELIAKYAEELSIMIQKLNTTLTRGDFEDFRSLLNEIKQYVAEIENRLNTLETILED